MKKIKKIFIVSLIGIIFIVSSTIMFSNAEMKKENQNVISRGELKRIKIPTTSIYEGYVARGETDWFTIEAVEPGLMELSVGWSNSYDIDCYICENPTTNNYLARGYTTNNPESCSYNIQTAGIYYIGIKMYSWWASNTAYTATLTYNTGSGADVENPAVSITSPSNGATVQGTISVEAGASDNVGVAYVQCNIDGGSWSQDSSSPYSWSLDTTTLTDASHTINVQAYDAAGNHAEDSITLTVDNSGSSVIHVEENKNGAVSGYEVDYYQIISEPGIMDVSVSWVGSNDIDCYICESMDYTNYLARGYTTSNPESCSYNIQTAGTYYVGVRMYTSSAATTDYTATIGYYKLQTGPDIENPTVSITSPSNGATVQGTISVEAGASDNVGVAYVQYNIDGGSWSQDSSSPYSWSLDTTILTDASHTINVQAYDAAGNHAEDSITITVDNSNPDPSKYALIVGVSDYKSISDLSYCDEDASDWFNYLTTVCGYEASNVIILGDGHTTDFPKYDGIATEANIKYYLNQLSQKNGEIAYITSGHGSGDGAGSSYLCAWDCGAGESGEDGDLYDTEIAAILDNAIADQIFVFIDHCYSGGIGPELLSMPNSNNVYCTITCTENGYGYDDSTHNNGAWTYYFVDYTLINHFSSSATTTMEAAFGYASANYPHSGGDAPMEFDGNPTSYFVI